MKRYSIRKQAWIFSALLMLPILSGIAGAAKSSYDLYSWPKPGATSWLFLLQPSSDQPVDAAVLRASPDVVHGKSTLKNQLMHLPKGATVQWKEIPEQGFVLPPADSVRSISLFSQQVDHPITLPKGKTPPVAH